MKEPRCGRSRTAPIHSSLLGNRKPGDSIDAEADLKPSQKQSWGTRSMNRMMRGISYFSVCALTGTLVAAAASAGSARAAEEVSYTLDVHPIIESRCTSCHAPGGAGYQQSGLDLTSYQGLMKGTKHGPIVVPGDPFTSNLNVLVEGRASTKLRMPHNQRPLLQAQQKILADWVRQGAKNN